MSKLLTVQEVAGMLRVSDQTVRRYIKEGRIKAQKLNKRDLRILESEAQAFLNNLAVEASE